MYSLSAPFALQGGWALLSRGASSSASSAGRGAKAGGGGDDEGAADDGPAAVEPGVGQIPDQGHPGAAEVGCIIKF